MRRAAIAIGSNSTRLLVADRQGNALQNICRGREETRLFLGLDDAGRITPACLEETARAVARLKQAALENGAETIALFATSATRDAQNSGELADRIKALCGLSLSIISGQEEAALAFRAAAGRQRRLVMDIGGGSTEWTLGENGAIQWSGSAQMGASRLLRACPVNSLADAQRALALAREALLPFAASITALPPAPQMIGLGGTCTTAASIALGRECHGEAAEGLTVTLDGAKGQLALLSSMTPEERARVPGLPPARAAHMPHGLCILIAGLELCGFDRITVSGRTNLDGYLLSLPE